MTGSGADTITDSTSDSQQLLNKPRYDFLFARLAFTSERESVGVRNRILNRYLLADAVDFMNVG